MTYLLKSEQALPAVQARGAELDGLPNTWEGLTAATRRTMLEGNANITFQRRVTERAAERAREAAGVYGEDRLEDDLSGLLWGSDSLRDRPDVIGSVIKDMAARPDDYGQMAFTLEDVEKEVAEQMQVERNAAMADIELMSPGGGVAAEIAGGIAGFAADLRNLPFMLVGGGGGSFLRVVGREAVLGAVAEGVTLPSRFNMAERLEIEDPDVLQTLAMGAAGGAVFGGLIEAGVRGVNYVSLYRQNRGRPVSVDEEFAAGAAEIAMTEGRDPVEAVRESMAEMTPPAPPPGRQPLVLTPDQRVDPAPLEPDIEDTVTQLRAEIDRLKSEDDNRRAPLIARLARNHRREIEPGVFGENFQINPDGAFGRELKARGVTSRTRPGLFSRQGRDDFDNMIRREWEEDFPGITEATGTALDADYLDRQGFLDLVRRSAEGDESWLSTRAAVTEMEGQLEELERAIELGGYERPLDAFQRGERTEGGPFIDDTYDIFEPWEKRNVIRNIVRAHADQRFSGADLTRGEVEEITSELVNSGGDVELLIERALERNLEYAERTGVTDDALDDIPFGDPAADNAAARGTGTQRPGQGAIAESGGGAGEGRLFEPTAAGDQAVLPGVAARSAAEVAMDAKAKAKARLADKARALDEGLFDLGSRGQADWLNEPLAPAPVKDAQIAAARAEITDDFDPMVPTEDGRSIPMSQYLDELDANEAAAARISLCGKGPTE